MAKAHLQKMSTIVLTLKRLSGLASIKETTVSETSPEYIVTLFCHGHTTVGKTFTMFGARDKKQPGFVLMALESIFAFIYHVI